MGVVDLDKRRFDAAVAGGWLSSSSRWRRRAAAVLREPLLHFFVVGLALFLAAQGWRQAHDVHRIVVTPERVADLATKYRMQFGTPPARAQLDRLVDGYIEEEVLYREGVAQGLDRDDEIVRRRIAQKAEFLQQDAPPAEPTDAQLRAFYASHVADYAAPRRYSFSHVYFSPEHGGDAAARARAEAALPRLSAGAAPGQIAADPFPDLNSYAAMGTAETIRIFGASELVGRLPQAPLGRWAGPYRSAYGWHLVRLEAAMPAKVPPFGEVRERIRADYFEDAHNRAGQRALASARSRYTVIRADLRDGAR
jgi:peptidyl-prolyl cis-trans isomerase C